MNDNYTFPCSKHTVLILATDKVVFCNTSIPVTHLLVSTLFIPKTKWTIFLITNANCHLPIYLCEQIFTKTKL